MNGAELPSMMGTSGEFNSMSTLSMLMLTRAARRCSTVSTETALHDSAVAKLDTGEVLHVGRHFVVAEVGAPEPDAEINRCGLQRQVDLVAGMKADANARNRAAKRPLCVHGPLSERRHAQTVKEQTDACMIMRRSMAAWLFYRAISPIFPSLAADRSVMSVGCQTHTFPRKRGHVTTARQLAVARE